jgi:DnaJ-class molecular chaperone
MRRQQHDDDQEEILRDGESRRFSMFAMDGIQKGVAGSSVRITDGEGGTTGLHRPGFRLSATDGSKRTTSDAIRDAAYSAYERELTTAWQGNRSRADAAAERTCPDCDGSGLGKYGDACKTCSGTGIVPTDYEESAEEVERNAETHHEGLGRNRRRVDHSTAEQMMRDHQNKMIEIYKKLDHELSETWRRP